ncbi:hypothetical protein BJ875DRAFT_446044 [Amylocarpus encephaloides]|uniref:Uncharacterized protein n=1 Tax=Amylocarpus encephaloides TaxID=45428 RepID=A0A9P7Y9Y6_9HELO|nr:hypothetical protein BJ875DRAFT_446044 [Amylocarpus encephaloides]
MQRHTAPSPLELHDQGYEGDISEPALSPSQTLPPSSTSTTFATMPPPRAPPSTRRDAHLALKIQGVVSEWLSHAQRTTLEEKRQSWRRSQDLRLQRVSWIAVEEIRGEMERLKMEDVDVDMDMDMEEPREDSPVDESGRPVFSPVRRPAGEVGAREGGSRRRRSMLAMLEERLAGIGAENGGGKDVEQLARLMLEEVQALSLC